MLVGGHELSEGHAGARYVVEARWVLVLILSDDVFVVVACQDVVEQVGLGGRVTQGKRIVKGFVSGLHLGLSRLAVLQVL